MRMETGKRNPNEIIQFVQNDTTKNKCLDRVKVINPSFLLTNQQEISNRNNTDWQHYDNSWYLSMLIKKQRENRIIDQ